MEVNAIRINDNNEILETSIKSLVVKKDSVFLVEIDKLEMPPDYYRRYAEDIKKAFEKVFPDNRILIIPKDTMKVNIITPEDGIVVKLSTDGAV